MNFGTTLIKFIIRLAKGIAIQPTQALLRSYSWRPVTTIVFASGLMLAQSGVQAQTITIAPIGDSITQGGNGRTSYRRALWHKLQQGGYDVDFVGSETAFDGNNPVVSDQDFDVDHEGHWAWEAGDIADNIDTWLAAYTPDIAIIHLGTNDFDRGQSNSSTLVELGRIFASLRTDNPLVTILIAEIIPMRNKDTSDLNTEIRSWAPAQSTTLSPVLVVNQYEDYDPTIDSYDNYHPNTVGEEKLASRWYSALSSVLDDGGNLSATCNGQPVDVFLANGDIPTANADVILGTPGPDNIIAMGGDDTICGLGGADNINGGPGHDWIDAGPGDDEVQGDSEDDVIFGDAGNDTLFGGSGNDTVVGEQGNDFLDGNSGNDKLYGGNGIDRISGGPDSVVAP